MSSTGTARWNGGSDLGELMMGNIVLTRTEASQPRVHVVAMPARYNRLWPCRPRPGVVSSMSQFASDDSWAATWLLSPQLGVDKRSCLHPNGWLPQLHRDDTGEDQ